ncbi:extracellular solute-binding protein [Blautia faecis]|uniref:extracellular solute-binding protein n=1 Tax=Blautia faecis TaxID=871665 RepID=UPI0022E3248C|nr:extracellular solute-binding protein [Blautia faecis]
MNKKLICTLMAGALLVGTVTGCGSSSEGESSAKGTELELFSSKAENKDILQKLVDKFNETHKDVTIKITAPADAGTVLKTRMAKNDMPDIVAMGGDNNYTEVESAGMLVDLSSEDYVSNIQESYLQMVYDVNKDKEEKVYGVPYATNASGVIYNVDKFKEHGIEIPKTWDEFIDVLEKLQDAGEQPLLMTYKDAWTSNCPWNSIASDLAPESFNDDRKAGKTTFVGTHEEIAEKYMKLLDYAQDDFMGLTYDDGNKAFANGEAAMIDGANPIQIFSRIIFPVLKPTTATVAILSFMWTWNDFTMPLVLLSDESQQTLQLAQYVFKKQFSVDYNLAFASYLLVLLPVLIVYIFCQKWIMNGVVAGAVK